MTIITNPGISQAQADGDIRFDPSSSNPIYIGLNPLNGAATSLLNWKLYKFAADGSRIQVAFNSWDNRASIF